MTWIDVSIYLVLAVHVICSVLLILIVLMQRPRSEGLGAAFGGGMTDSLLGAGTTDFLTKGTIWLGSVFMAATLLLAVLYAHREPADSTFRKQLEAVPAAETTPATPAPAEAAAPAATQTSPAPAAPSSQPASSKPASGRP